MGHYKAGKYKNQYKYKSFTPSFINKPFQWEDKKIDIILEEAVRYLGELNAYSLLVPDVDFFIKMHVTKEATASSRIEGTKTNIDEAVLSEEDINPGKRDDWIEVQNYIKALNSSIVSLDRRPISLRLIKEAHEVLLSGVRGEHKQPGEIRKSQNWIGGSSLRDAFYIPPHQEDLPELLSDWEKFWYNEDLDIPLLIKIAISHYQFESIHPFLDGNGRMGRLIIIQLMEKGILKKPALYLSSFFDRNRGAYYDALTLVRTNNNMEHWIKFFLSGIIEISRNSIETFRKIIDLRQSIEKKIIGFGKQAGHGHELLEAAFSNPALTANKCARILNVSFPTASKLLKRMESIGVFKEVTGYSRHRLFVFDEYLALFK